MFMAISGVTASGVGKITPSHGSCLLSSTVSCFLTPGFLTPGFLTPGFLTPGFLTPGFLTPGFLTPSFLTLAS
jgi:hypothetical protein